MARNNRFTTDSLAMWSSRPIRTRSAYPSDSLASCSNYRVSA